jgi:putative FmdB family regulatory protein
MAVMPLFEYECRGCGRRFEHLTRDGQAPACPACHGDDLQKLLSAFAVGAGSPSGARGLSRGDAAGPGACGSCGDPRGPGACSMN